jgi:hypothetical protein
MPDLLRREWQLTLDDALPEAPPPPRTSARLHMADTLGNRKLGNSLMRSGQVKPMFADVV